MPLSLTDPSKRSIAFWASSGVLITTKAKPRLRPVSRSQITWNSRHSHEHNETGEPIETRGPTLGAGTQAETGGSPYQEAETGAEAGAKACREARIQAEAGGRDTGRGWGQGM